MERGPLDRLQLDRFDDARRREAYRSGMSTPQSSRASVDYGNEVSMNWPQPVSAPPRSSASDPRGMLPAPLPASRLASHSPMAKSDLTLPPLRSVLGSPPNTPGPSQTTLHPSPRDSGYEQTSYKLPEITNQARKRNYPEEHWERKNPRYSPESAPPGSPYSRRDSKTVAALMADERLSWPQSGQPGTASTSQNIREHSSRSYSDPERNMARTAGGHAPPSMMHYPYSAPAPAAHPGTEYDTRGMVQGREAWQGGHEMRDGRPTLDDQRRSSQRSALDPLPYRGNPVSHAPLPPQPHGPPHLGPPDGYYGVVPGPSQPPPFTNPEYLHDGHGYPTAYEYSGSKSRKRSNLPKQSTEIMKRWFEEHIDNPYPSEEQKKYFATKANINLTQVSNWFINHRRRCPELKDKREKNPSTSRENSQ